MSTTITAKCVDQNFRIVSAPDIASGGVNEDYLVVEFCPLWEGYDKTAVFYRTKDEVYHAPLDEEGKCTIPWEVMQTPGHLYLGVFGCKDDITRTSLVARYAVKPGAITEETRPSEPTPNIYEQILSKFIPKGGSKGQVLRKKSDADHDMEWGEGGGGGDNVFFAEYYRTRYADILAAHEQEKVCILQSGGRNILFDYFNDLNGIICASYVADTSEGHTFYEYTVNKNDEWKLTSTDFVKSKDIPRYLPNPNDLVISSLFEQKRYNGRTEVEITIPQKMILGLMQTDGVWQIAFLDGGQILTPEAFEMLYANGAIIEVVNAETGELYSFDGISFDTGAVIFARQDGATRKEAALQADGTVTVEETTAEVQLADFVVTVDSHSIADKTWAEVFEARQEGRRIYLDHTGMRYDYTGEGYDFSRFRRIDGTTFQYADLPDWEQTVNFHEEHINSVPTPTAEDNGKALVVENGSAVWSEIAGGGGEDYSKPAVRLVADVAIPQDTLPERVEITEDMEGNPLALRKFIVQSDIKTSVSYTNIGLNGMGGSCNANISHGSLRTSNYYESRDEVFIYRGSAENMTLVNGATNMQNKVAVIPGVITSIKIPANDSIASGKKIRVWELID